MFRVTSPTRLFIPIYHRGALPLGQGHHWVGKFGAMSRFHDKTIMTAPVTRRKSIATIDREMMNYVHTTRLRHNQLSRSYHHWAPTSKRILADGVMLRRKRNRKLQTAFKAYFQYEVKQILSEQARLVNEHGQVAVNRALGEPLNEREAERRMALVERRVRATPVVPPVKRHIATQFQQHNDRFDTHWRQASQN